MTVSAILKLLVSKNDTKCFSKQYMYSLHESDWRWMIWILLCDAYWNKYHLCGITANVGVESEYSSDYRLFKKIIETADLLHSHKNTCAQNTHWLHKNN